jgi:hypothetical protein
MSTPHDKVAVARVRDELATEHDAIRALVARLRAPGKSQEEAAGLLDELHGRLAEHFAHEEYPGGFYETLGACTHEHGDDLRILVDDHFLLLSTARALRDRARGAGADASFDQEVSTLTDRISSHERREHALAEKLAH